MRTENLLVAVVVELLELVHLQEDALLPVSVMPIHNLLFRGTLAKQIVIVILLRSTFLLVICTFGASLWLGCLLSTQVYLVEVTFEVRSVLLMLKSDLLTKESGFLLAWTFNLVLFLKT